MRYFVVLLFIALSTHAAAPKDFSSAKTMLRSLFPSQSTTWYCGCTFRWQGDKAKLDLASCGYQVRKNVQRAQRLEWEHVVPAQQFGHQMACWQQGGRDLCERKDAAFSRIEGDLYNLRPAIGEVNGDRAHYRFAELPDKATPYGACDMEIDHQRERVEPRDAIKGDIARIYFYMMDRYKVPVTDRELQLFRLWDKQDPVDAAERELNLRIARVMGWPNRFVTGDTHASELTAVPLPSAQPASQSPQDRGNATQSAVVGNKKSKKYHKQGCAGFSQVSEANRVWFDSETQAQASGYVKAGNCQ